MSEINIAADVVNERFPLDAMEPDTAHKPLFDFLIEDREIRTPRFIEI